jgi:hypothetical protein
MVEEDNKKSYKVVVLVALTSALLGALFRLLVEVLTCN